nr:MAG TPA: Large polyvalent protein associated domain 38 [Caudoviricetes sp.]
MVADYENEHNTDTLWQRVNDTNKAILSKCYESGLMSKDVYEKVRDMYKWYIPLRGFDEATVDDMYAYMGNGKGGAFSSPIKAAKGRKSKADDPFANMSAMADSAIMQGNRNTLVKRRFLNFILNRPNDLITINDVWLARNTLTGEWHPVFPDINDGDSPAEVQRKTQEFEDKMADLSKNDPGNYALQKEHPEIPYVVPRKSEMKQHQIMVQTGDKTYVLTVNGNPRLAQALNGLTNPDSDSASIAGHLMQQMEWANRHLSSLYTTRNPDFVLSNLIRDTLYSGTMVWIKENPGYAAKFNLNLLRANPFKVLRLLTKYENGALDKSQKLQKYFDEFMRNGGETGYTIVRDIEGHKKELKRELRRAGSKAYDIYRALGEAADNINRAIENSARFAAYVTSREAGRPVDRSIYDAKEVSVNFNKKGSGATFLGANGETLVGNAASAVSGAGRDFYVFWNAAVQGTTNFARQAKRHPAKVLAGAAVMFLAGYLFALNGNDGGDDKDKKAGSSSYFDLPPYVRRSNIVFRAGDNMFVSLPLPVEYRSVYGMGELFASIATGREKMTDEELATEMLSQVSQMLPIDFMEGSGGAGAFVPSTVKPLWEARENRSWTGLPIYKENDFNKDMPEWTKAYKSTNTYLKNLSAALSEASGGDRGMRGAIEINPAKVEYVLNGYLGGVYSTVDKMVKMGETVAGDRDFDPRSFLLLNRVLKSGDERTRYRAINNLYYDRAEEADIVRQREREYKRAIANQNISAEERMKYERKLEDLYNSEEFRRAKIFGGYKKAVDKLRNVQKDTGEDPELQSIEQDLRNEAVK